MSAQENLNPQQFYHGTAARLRKGSVIEPGHPANWDSDLTLDRQRQYAFATTSVTDAVRYAGRAEYKQQARDSNAKGHIYQVEPVDPKSVSVDPEDDNRSMGREPDAFRSNVGWRVTGTVPYKKARKQAGYKD